MDVTDIDNCIINQSPNFEVTHCTLLGRYMVATRDIKKGEIILKEKPIISGPIRSTELLCPGCYQTPEINCSLCGWPICGSTCTGAKTHQQFGKVFQSRLSPSSRENYDWSKFTDSLMAVRCLLLKQVDPEKWKNLLEMETNWESWSRSPLYSNAKRLEELVRNEYGLSETEYPSSDILTVQAILDINAYEVQLSDSSIQAAYKVASLAEHNCVPNTHKTTCTDTLEVTFRAATDIPQGTHISTTYCDVLWPTWHRQKFLQWSKFFTCGCERCQSATELESHLASFVCVRCYDSSGKVAASLPVFTEQENWASASVMKEYFCTACNARYPALECQMTLKKADDELTELDKYASLEIISIFEEWLNKWTLMEAISKCEAAEDDDRSKEVNECDESQQIEIFKRRKTDTCYARTALLLHPQNSLVLDACHTLFLLYPKEDTTLEQLKRKQCLGTHLLKATKPLFTGISKFRGTISYELAITKAALLVNQLERSGMTDNLHHLAKEVLQLLNESLELLKYEPLDQPEGKLAQTATSQLDQLASFFSELFPSLTRHT